MVKKSHLNSKKNNHTYKWYNETQQMKSSLDKKSYKDVYDHIIYMCDCFGEFKRLFVVVCIDFHGGVGLQPICFLFEHQHR
jgi:hypothetical protein